MYREPDNFITLVTTDNTQRAMPPHISSDIWNLRYKVLPTHSFSLLWCGGHSRPIQYSRVYFCQWTPQVWHLKCGEGIFTTCWMWKWKNIPTALEEKVIILWLSNSLFSVHLLAVPLFEVRSLSPDSCLRQLTLCDKNSVSHLRFRMLSKIQS